MVRNAAHVLADEFEAIRVTSQLGGEALLNQRVAKLELSGPTEYFSFLVQKTSQVTQMLKQVMDAGITQRAFGSLEDECMNAAFMFKTGWGSTQAFGSHRVPVHLVHNLESLGNLHRAYFQPKEIEDSRCTKIREEVESLREFVTENSPDGSNRSVLLSSIDHILRLLDAESVDHVELSSQISALLGLLVLFSGTFEAEEDRKRWFDRVKTGVVVLGTELFLTASSDLGSLAFQNALGITQ